MTLRQEAYSMIDSLPNDDSVKFFIDMIKQFNAVVGKTGVFAHGRVEEKISIPERL